MTDPLLTLYPMRPSRRLDSLALAFEFTQWASQTTPTIDAIKSRFGVSRASAFRYRRAWLDAIHKCAGGKGHASGIGQSA